MDIEYAQKHDLAKTWTLDTSPTLIYACAAVNWLEKKVNQLPAARSWESFSGLWQALTVMCKHINISLLNA